MLERNKEWIESTVEAFLFASRWILAPFYIGLSLAMVALLVKFVGEFIHVVQLAVKATEAEMILGILTLVDLALTGSLLVIVIFSGYENFVSKFDHSDHRDWPEWMGTIDFTALKLKLLSSIVAISGVQLLKQFMDLTKVPDREIYWYVVIHLTFVASSVLLALSDRISGEAGPSPGPHGKKAPSGGASEQESDEPKKSSVD
jgi:uncharacterized protein (TIGR00645 family)